MLIRSKPQITWNNVMSDKLKQKLSNKIIRDTAPTVPWKVTSADILMHAHTRLMTVTYNFH